MATKVTYTLDDDTVRQIRRLADRSRKPQSAVVREAVAHYAAREDKLTAEERERQLRVINDMLTRPRRAGDKTRADVDRELRQVRRLRRSGGRRHPA